jgi:hypothetical protein
VPLAGPTLCHNIYHHHHHHPILNNHNISFEKGWVRERSCCYHRGEFKNSNSFSMANIKLDGSGGARCTRQHVPPD